MLTEFATFALGAGATAEWVFTSPSFVPSQDGILSVRVGVASGSGPDVICEAVQIEFDADTVSYGEFIGAFLKVCDPRHMPNGSSSVFGDVIFAHSFEQREVAREWVARLWPGRGRDGEMRELPVSLMAGFTVAPEAEQQVVSRLFVQGDLRFPPLSPSGSQKIDDPSLTEFRSFAARICGCLGDTDRNLSPRYPSLVEQALAVLRYEPRSVQTLTTALRRLTSTRSTGLANGQLDIRLAEVGVAPLSAESHVRISRTESALRLVCNLRRGNARLDGGAISVKRYATTDVDQGHVVDTVDAIASSDMLDQHGRRITDTRQPRFVAHCFDVDGPSWHDHIPPVEMPVACGSTIHTVRWSEGRFEAPATIGVDALRERTLIALGAAGCYCWMLAAIWDPRWILQRFLPISVDELFRPGPWWIGASVERPLPHHGWVFEAPEMRAARRAAFSPRSKLDPAWAELPNLEDALNDPISSHRTDPAKQAVMRLIYTPLRLQLPSFQTRWLLTTLAWLGEHHTKLGPDDRTNHASLVFRHIERPLLEALWQPCRSDPNVTVAAIQLHLLQHDEPAWVTGTVNNDTVHIDVGVSFRWISRVWVRCLAIVDGHLVLDADGPSGATELGAIVAQWDRDNQHSAGAILATKQTTIQWDGMRWRLAPPPKSAASTL